MGFGQLPFVRVQVIGSVHRPHGALQAHAHSQCGPRSPVEGNSRRAGGAAQCVIRSQGGDYRIQSRSGLSVGIPVNQLREGEILQDIARVVNDADEPAANVPRANDAPATGPS